MADGSGARPTRFTPPSFAVCALLALLLFAALLSTGLTTFQTNDDTNSIAFVTGQFTGAPDPHLIWPHVLLGRLLVGLYGLIHSVNWYAWLLLITHFLSFTALVYTISRPVKDWISFFFLTLVLWVLYAPFLITLTFTTTGFAACAAGFVLFSADLFTERDVPIWNRWLGGFLLILGTM